MGPLDCPRPVLTAYSPLCCNLGTTQSGEHNVRTSNFETNNENAHVVLLFQNENTVGPLFVLQFMTDVRMLSVKSYKLTRN